MSYRLIDLYAGAGGFTCGFTQEGYVPIWANEMDEDAARTYAVNFGDHVTVARLEDALADPEIEVPEADIVVGGPPCQGFSAMNKSATKHRDPRREQWRPYLETVERSGAPVFIMENVPLLLASVEYTEFLRQAQALGFTVGARVLNAADYGTPQARRRAIVFGVKGGLLMGKIPPPVTHTPDRYVTLKDAIGDLPGEIDPELTTFRDEPPPLDLHFNPLTHGEKMMARIKSVPPGGARHDIPEELWHPAWHNIPDSQHPEVYGRMFWDRPSSTLRTRFCEPAQGRYIRPDCDRGLTLREGARLQGFPDDFTFTGAMSAIQTQIGNAVPPPLARAVARTARELLEEVGR